MEMHATTARWQDGRLYVEESTQGVVNHRNFLANVFDLNSEQVEVRAPFIGSGFGGKLWPWPHSIAACAAAAPCSGYRESGKAETSRGFSLASGRSGCSLGCVLRLAFATGQPDWSPSLASFVCIPPGAALALASSVGTARQ